MTTLLTAIALLLLLGLCLGAAIGALERNW